MLNLFEMSCYFGLLDAHFIAFELQAESMESIRREKALNNSTFVIQLFCFSPVSRKCFGALYTELSILRNIIEKSININWSVKNVTNRDKMVVSP